jgi:hypothetical protein
MADTGWNVLEANVETTTVILKKSKSDFFGVFLDILDSLEKENDLNKSINLIDPSITKPNIFFKNSLDFEKLPNSIIGYYFQDYLINIFKRIKNLENYGYNARKGNDFVSFEHYRNYWESISYESFTHLYNGGGYLTFYLPYKELVKSIFPEEYYKHHKSINIRNREYQFRKGVGYGKFGNLIDAHVLKEGFMFTSEGLAISNLTEEDSIVLNGFVNSIFVQFIINQYCGLHKQVGYINLLPFPKTGNNHFERIRQLVIQILKLKRFWFSLDETCLEFHHLLNNFSKGKSIKDELPNLYRKLKTDNETYNHLIENNDNFWLDAADIPKDSRPIFDEFKKKRQKENLITIDGVTDETTENNPAMAHEIISNLLGVAFGRWDIRSIKDPSLIPDFGDFFDPLPFMPVVSLSGKPNNYPLDFPEDGLFIQDNRHRSRKSRLSDHIWPV